MDEFLKVIDKIKALADKGKTVGELIEELLKMVDFEKHWREDKWEDRLENIKELVRSCFASSHHLEAELIYRQYASIETGQLLRHRRRERGEGDRAA